MRLPLPRPYQRVCSAARPGAGARAWQVAWLACLLLALAWVPTLGRVHQALHSGDHRAVPIYGLAHTGMPVMLRTPMPVRRRHQPQPR